jgi:hypothetical protein
MKSLLFTFFTLIGSQGFCYLQKTETPTTQFLRSIQITEPNSGVELIDCVYVINLDERPEKWEQLAPLLKKQGIKANRVSAVNGWKITTQDKKILTGPYYSKLKGGEIGTLLSHISIIKDAYERGFERIWVLEDDVEFLYGSDQIPNLIRELTSIDPCWDTLYTDTDSRNRDDSGYCRSLGTNPRSDQKIEHLLHYLKRAPQSANITLLRQRFGAYSFIVSRSGIEKLFNYFSHVYLWSQIDVDMHFVPHIRQYCTSRDIVTNNRSALSDARDSNH